MFISVCDWIVYWIYLSNIFIWLILSIYDNRIDIVVCVRFVNIFVFMDWF